MSVLSRTDLSRCPHTLKLELERLKRESVAPAFKASADALTPVVAWPHKTNDQIAPLVAKIRGFAKQVLEVRCVLLVVEDDAVARLLTAAALEEHYDVVFSHDGAVALGVLRRLVPSLILMDVHLPDMDGIALARSLKKVRHLANVSVLMLTGSAHRETLNSSMSAGAAGFIVKPFTRVALLAKLEGLLAPTSRHLVASRRIGTKGEGERVVPQT